MLSRSAARAHAAGMSLIEILVVLAVMVTLSAAFIPSVIRGLDRARVSESAESLEAIGIAAGNMWKDVGVFPGRLSDLTSPISAAGKDLCGIGYGAAAAAAWAGPYLNRSVTTGGMTLPIGTFRDSLGYSAAPPVLVLTGDSVDEGDVRALDEKVDGDGDPGKGAVQWGIVTPSGIVELRYVRPARPCG